MFQASISQLMTAPEGLLTKRVSEEQVNHIKHILRDNRPRQLPVLPVMVCGGIWSGKVRRQDKFIVLGGYPLFLAVKDLSTDEKFSDYRNLSVNIFHDVGTSELHQVEALYGLQASLLQGGGDRLQTKVHAFRRILYDLMKTAPDGEPVKPGLKDSAQWRRMCAASVGKSTERCTMKALEPTFQLAQYSNRCYEKLGRIFEMELEKGKEVKQSAFLPLQGVAEGERFDILGGVVSGEISLKDVKKIATEKKMDKGAKEELVRQMEVASWEEAVAEFPLHTSEEILKPYRGMDFKKSIPRSFLHLVQAAKHWKENTTGEDIMVGQEKVLFVRRAGDVGTNANIELAFVNVRQNSDITDFQEALKTRTVTVHICEDVLLAGRTVEHLEAKPHSYSVLLNKEENKVQHLVTSVWRADGIAEKPPHLGKILTLSGGMYQTWVDRFTSPSDLVLMFGPIADATVAAVGQGRRVIAVTECREVKESVQVMIRQSSLLDGSDPYNYSDD